MVEPSQLEVFRDGAASADGEVPQTPAKYLKGWGGMSGKKSGLIRVNSRADGPSYVVEPKKSSHASPTCYRETLGDHQSCKGEKAEDGKGGRK